MNNSIELVAKSIVSWNVNGLRRILKADGDPLRDYVKEHDPDILFLQETKIEKPETETELTSALDGYIGYFNSLTTNSSGVVAYIKKSFSQQMERDQVESTITTVGKEFEVKDELIKGRIITIKFPTYYVVNTYVPHSGMKLEKLETRAEWDNMVLNYLNHLRKDKPVIWCGDLNVANDDIDLKNPKSNRNKTAGFTDQERDSFKIILVKSNMVDKFREDNPTDETYSFWSWRRKENREKNIGWRLDYFAVPIELSNSDSIKVEYQTDIMGSDHCPCRLTLLPNPEN